MDLLIRPERHVRNSIATLSVAIGITLRKLYLDALLPTRDATPKVYGTVRLGLSNHQLKPGLDQLAELRN